MNYTLPCLPAEGYIALIKAVTARPNYPQSPAFALRTPSAKLQHVREVIAEFNRHWSGLRDYMGTNED